MHLTPGVVHNFPLEGSGFIVCLFPVHKKIQYTPSKRGEDNHKKNLSLVSTMDGSTLSRDCGGELLYIYAEHTVKKRETEYVGKVAPCTVTICKLMASHPPSAFSHLPSEPYAKQKGDKV